MLAAVEALEGVDQGFRVRFLSLLRRVLLLLLFRAAAVVRVCGGGAGGGGAAGVVAVVDRCPVATSGLAVVRFVHLVRLKLSVGR